MLPYDLAVKREQIFCIAPFGSEDAVIDSIATPVVRHEVVAAKYAFLYSSDVLQCLPCRRIKGVGLEFNAFTLKRFKRVFQQQIFGAPIDTSSPILLP